MKSYDFQMDFENYIESVEDEFVKFLKTRKAEEYIEFINIIKESQNKMGRIHITGIGKPGHVAEYIASLFSSTGNPCYFLDCTEAVHGSCGQLVNGDVVICISNSGETEEMKNTVLAIKKNGCKIIGVSGNHKSWLANNSDAFLYAGVKMEGGPLNKAPRNSVLAEILTLQVLSVILQSEKKWSVEDYLRCHPGGQLGKVNLEN